MKTKNIITAIILSSIFIFSGCNKEDDIKVNSDTNKNLIKEIQSKIESTKADKNIKSNSQIDPVNPDNYMDYIGEYFESMISSVNASEVDDPSSTQENYESKYLSYYSDNDIGYNFNDLLLDTTNSFLGIADLAMNYFLQDEADVSVSNLITFENIIIYHNAISQEQKVFLLSLSASLKYTRAIMKNEGITINGEQFVEMGSIYLLAGCFDKNFKEGYHHVAKSLVDFENPGVFIFAWGTLPMTMIRSIGNGLYRAATKGC